jgi:methylmalonyl-CoA mutase, C-terminal domain
LDAVGSSLLSGAHMELVGETMLRLSQLGRADIKVFVGGTIPKKDRQALLDMGVAGVFTAEMKIADVLDHIDRELS